MAAIASPPWAVGTWADDAWGDDTWGAFVAPILLDLCETETSSLMPERTTGSLMPVRTTAAYCEHEE
jgi:hypothetical protein